MAEEYSEKTGTDSPAQESNGSQEHSRKESLVPHAEHSEDNIDKMRAEDDLEAFKSDNSDGKINWTPQQICATISLALIYVGMFAIFLITVYQDRRTLLMVDIIQGPKSHCISPVAPLDS
jgi:hypothetical protein